MSKKESSEEKRAIRNEVRASLVDKLIEEYKLSHDEVVEVVELYYECKNSALCTPINPE
jgi:hypothetical protein